MKETNAEYKKEEKIKNFQGEKEFERKKHISNSGISFGDKKFGIGDWTILKNSNKCFEFFLNKI
jgi:hypothetical protein